MISQEEFKILKSFAERIPSNDSGAHNNLAIVYYNKGLYDEAIEELEEALKIDPNFVLARNNFDIVLKKTGRLEEKIEKLARIIDSNPDDEKKTLELADTYRKLNRYSQSIIFYRKVIDINPDSFESHYGLGVILKLLRKYDDALEEIKIALEIKIAPEVYRTLGEIYFSKGVIDLAIKNFQESIALDPSSAEGYYLLGFAFGEKGKVDESLEAIKKAIALNPALAQLDPNLLINIKEHKGHWEFLKEHIAIPTSSRNDYQLHFNLGMTYRNKGLFNEAKREFDECLKMQSDKPDIYLILGEINIFLNKFDDALKYLKKAYDSNFEPAKCTNALGVVYYLTNNFNRATEFFQKALTLQKGFMQALNNLGVGEFNKGNIKEAVEYYQKAIDAGSSHARFNLGMHYLKNKDYDTALNLFSGDIADEYFGKGLVYIELGKVDTALDFFKKSLSLSPNHAGAYYNIGFIFTKLGRFKEGLDYIRKGIEIEPNYEKDKFLLSLEPELFEFGPYCSTNLDQEMEFDVAEEELPVLEVTNAENYVTSAENYLERNEFEKALSMVEQAIKLEPEQSTAVILKTKILFETGNTYDAVNFISSYTKYHPQDKEVKAALGGMLKESGQLREAKKVYLEMLELEEDNLEWLVEVANISYKMNDLDEAMLFYNKIYNINSENVAANLGFLKIHVKNRDFEKATPYMVFLKEKHPDMYDFNILAGLYYLEKNEYKESFLHFEKAIELDSSKPLPYYQIGLLQVQQGNFDVACDNWKKALLLSPGEELVKKVRHCLRITVELNEFLKKEV